MNHVIQHPEHDQYWSMYGWGALVQAMRFRTMSDAQQFRDSHGLFGARLTTGKFTDNNRRPDATADYNPFGL